MIIVLTSERDLPNEANQINQLFAAGLERLHLRKPTFDMEGYRTLLNAIDSQYYKRIMIHQYHELCDEFKLRGVHLQEQPRIDLGAGLLEYVSAYQKKGYTVSSSFHTKEAIQVCTVPFEYVLLSPVFGSISKAGYEGKGFEVTDLKANVIGMGGINAVTIPKALDLGFVGVGVLGGVWNVEHPIHSFQQMQKCFV